MFLCVIDFIIPYSFLEFLKYTCNTLYYIKQWIQYKVLILATSALIHKSLFVNLDE